jgi:hypothetical protein
MITAVTIGVGRAYREMAELAAASVQRWTGLEPVVIRNTRGIHPAKYKLKLLEQFDGPVFYFDADTRMVGPWPELLGYGSSPAFRASAHEPAAAVAQDCAHYKLDQRVYFYSGAWIANREHHGEAFRLADEICHAEGYVTQFAYEQTALNVSMQRLRIPIEPLPPARHVICTRGRQYAIPPDAALLHVAGRGLQIENRKIFEREIMRRERCD